MNDTEFAHIIMAVCTILPGILIKVFGRTNPETGKTGWATYNTPMSKLTKESQAFANAYAGTGMVWAGLILLCIQITSYFLFGGNTSLIIMVIAMTFGFIPVIVLTERELGKRFDKDGKPIEGYSQF